jgi:hypothetical protein
MSEDTISSEEWGNNLARLSRRSLIASRYSKRGKKSLAQIINSVRDQEKQLGVDALINQLINSEYSLESSTAGIAEDLSVYARELYPDIEGVVVLGSSMDGGKNVRKFTNSNEVSDLDWGVLTKLFLDPTDLYDLAHKSKKIIREIGQKHGVRNLKPCERFSPPRCNAISLVSDQQAYDVLKRLGRDVIAPWETDLYTGQVLLYLPPSFPIEVNETNRAHLLEGLKELSATDRDSWKRTIDRIEKAHTAVHAIKAKHLNIAPTLRDRKLRDEVVANSAQAMSRPLAILLQSTDTTAYSQS